MYQQNIQAGTGDHVVISIDGEEYGVYDLGKNQQIEVQEDIGTNTVLIEDGTVSMVEADCPDHYCVEHTVISKPNQTIVCLPHKLVVEIQSDNQENEEIIYGS